MTKEEAIEYNKNLREYMRITDKNSEYKFLKENYEALDMAIQALKQTELNSSYNRIKTELDCISRTDALNAFKPKGISEELWMESNTYRVLTKLPSVTPKAESGEISVLDKIRAEIEQLKLHKAQFITDDNKVCIDSQQVLNVIDKYMIESEDEEMRRDEFPIVDKFVKNSINEVLDKIVAEIEDTGAYEQEVNGKTEFLEGITYCLNIINKYRAKSEE